MYIPCEASSCTLLHQNRKLSSRISLQNQLFCLCRLPAVHTVGTVPNVLLKKWSHLPNILKEFPATYPCFLTMISIYSPIMLANIHLMHSSFPFSLISMLTNHLIACYTQLHGLFVKRDDLNYYKKENIVLNLRYYCFFYWKSCFEMTRIKTTTKSTFFT